MKVGAKSAREAAREAAERLALSGVPEPEASSEVLLSELLGIQRGGIPFHHDPLSKEELSIYEAWLHRRLDREPVQCILGYAYFRNLRLYLGDETLIPRPDTESVVEAALERIDRRGERRGYPCRVLDLGTGSGAIAVSIAQERPRCEVHATDVSEAALHVASRNAAEAGVEVEFHLSDMASGLETLSGSVDLLISNPPYVRSEELETLAPEVRDHDPFLALDGGLDGLDFYRRILEETPPLLKAGAEVVLEVGEGQAEDVLRLGEHAGFEPVGVREDLAGTPRAVILGWGG